MHPLCNLILFVLTLWPLTATPCVVERGPVTRTIIVEGELDALDTVPVYSSFTGVIEWILPDGSSVSRGDPIIRIDTWKANQDLAKLRLEEERKQMSLAKQRLDDQLIEIQEELDAVKDQNNEEIAAIDVDLRLHARGAIEMKTKQLEIAKLKQMIQFYDTHLKEMGKLSDQGALSQNELEDLRLKAKETQISLQRQMLEYQKLVDGDAMAIESAQNALRKAKLRKDANIRRNQGSSEARKRNMEVLEAELSDIRQRRLELESGINASTLTSPVDGTLLLELRWTGNNMGVFDVGADVSNETMIARISTSRRVKAKYPVQEVDQGLIQPGQLAEVEIVPLGYKKIKGQVSRIGKALRAKANWSRDRYRLHTIDIEVELLEQVDGFKPKMSTIARVVIEKVDNGLRIPGHCLSASSSLVDASGNHVFVSPTIVGSSFVGLSEDGFKSGQTFQTLLRQEVDFASLTRSYTVSDEVIFEAVNGSGELASADEFAISPAFSAKINKLAGSGEEVKAGTVLFELDVQDLETQQKTKEVELTERKVELQTTTAQNEQRLTDLKEQLLSATQRLAIAKKQLDILNASDPAEEKKVKKIALDLAKVELEFQSRRFDTQTEMRKSGFLKASEYQQAFEQLQNARNQVQLKELDLELSGLPANSSERRKQALLVDNLSKEVATLERTRLLQSELSSVNLKDSALALNQVELDLANITSSLQKSVVTAPQDGVFIVQEQFKGRTLEPYSPGDQARPGMVIGNLVQMKNFQIKGKVPEQAFNKLASGQNAIFSLSGRTEDKFSAVLKRVSPIPLKQTIYGNVEPIVDVVLDVTGFSPTFQPGASVVYEIAVTNKSTSPVIPRDAIFQIGDQTYVATARNKSSLRPVKMGIRQGNRVEIIEGLKSGDVIYMEPVQ